MRWVRIISCSQAVVGRPVPSDYEVTGAFLLQEPGLWEINSQGSPANNSCPAYSFRTHFTYTRNNASIVHIARRVGGNRATIKSSKSSARAQK